MTLFAAPDLATVGLVIAVTLIVAIRLGAFVSYPGALTPTVNRHVGVPWNRATVLTRPLLNWERVNLFLALEALREETPDARVVIGMGYFGDLAGALHQNASRNAPLEYTVKPVG